MTWVLMIVLISFAQIQEPVKVSTSFEKLSDTEVEIIFSAAIEEGWHMYSTDLGSGGPISASFNIDEISGATLEGKLRTEGNEVTKFDKLFEMQVRYFANEAKFIQKLRLTSSSYDIEGYFEYGACNDENCLPPTQVPFHFTGTTNLTSSSSTPVSAVDNDIVGTETVVETKGQLTPDELWRPVVNELHSFGDEETAQDMSWIYIFVTGFLGGLLALLTPCVWPIIPMTVSFFLKRSKDKKKGIRDAWTYGASIVVIYVKIGRAHV